MILPTLLVSLILSFTFPNPVYADIVIMSELYDVDTQTALEIATCESQMGKYPINWEGSSAKGVYMFTDGTWDAYCEGDAMNPHDNITCFMELFPKHPTWWDCYNILYETNP